MAIPKDNRMIYKGISTKQVKGVTQIFDQFFMKEQFDTVIEIGTGTGGFTLYIAEKCNEMKANFYTFDIRSLMKVKERNELEHLGGVFFKENITKTDRVKNFIKSGGRTLVLNDGIKNVVFDVYGPMLKPGDYMFIHDYYYKIPSIFDKVATWKDFKDGIKKFKLNISNYTKMFEEYLWICIKKDDV